MLTRCAFLLLASAAWAQLRVDFGVGAVAGSDNILYALSGTNLFRTADAGANWVATHPTAAPGQPQGVLAIATNPLDPSIVYVATDLAKGGIWKSSDSGATWTKMNTGLPATGTIEKFFSVENQPSTFYLKIGLTVYKSTDAAASWTLQSTLPAVGSVFTINARTPSLMYFVRQAVGDSPIVTVYRSTTEGATWDIANTVAIKPTGEPNFGNNAGAIASSPADASLVFLSTRGPYGEAPYNALHKGTNAVQPSPWLAPGEVRKGFWLIPPGIFSGRPLNTQPPFLAWRRATLLDCLGRRNRLYRPGMASRNCLSICVARATCSLVFRVERIAALMQVKPGRVFPGL